MRACRYCNLPQTEDGFMKYRPNEWECGTVLRDGKHLRSSWCISLGQSRTVTFGWHDAVDAHLSKQEDA